MMNFTAEEVRDCFNDSFLALFFPDLKNEAGQEYILALAEYVLGCGNGQYIAENCPNIFCCWASHYMAWLLATWAAADIAEDGTVCLSDPSACIPATHLTKKTIGDKQCEWTLTDMSKTCCPCPPSAMEEWEAKWKELMECCNAANTPLFIAAGSYTGKDKCKPKGCGCGADNWNYYG